MGNVAAILFRTPTQVNAKGLLREVQAAQEGVETGALRGHSLALDCYALHFKVAAEEQRP